MSDAEFDLICIGSGPAGQRAAFRPRSSGKRVAVVEKQALRRGSLHRDRHDPSKTFREAVRRLLAPGARRREPRLSRRPRWPARRHVGRVI